MSRVVLFNAVDSPSNLSSLMPDVGLASLAASLLDAGHAVEIVDIGTVSTLAAQMTSEERREVARYASIVKDRPLTPTEMMQVMALEIHFEAALLRAYVEAFAGVDRRIAWRHVDLLGLKLWAGPGARIALGVARDLVRREPGLRVIAGGPLVTLRPEALLDDNPWLSAVVVGYGEESVVGLAEYAAGRRTRSAIPNLLWREGASVERSERRTPDPAGLPFPSYDPAVYPAMDGDEKLPVIAIDDSRGCPMDCHFCAHPTLTGGEWLRMPAERVVAQMDAAHAQTGALGFRFSGSYTPPRLYRGVGETLSARGAPYLYSGFAHVDGVAERDLPALRRSGLIALFFGVESGDEDLLRTTLGKDIDPARTLRVLSAAMDAGIYVCGSVIFPAPGESEASADRTRELLLALFRDRENGSALVLPPLLQPGSRWWREPERFGFEGDREAVLDALCERRVRRVLPMDAFEPLPYRLDGAGQKDVAARTADLTRTLRGEGVIVNMGHDAALFAALAGSEPRAFLDEEHEIFLTADAERARGVIQRMRSIRSFPTRGGPNRR